jgi:tetratricopeptide (TPR) repeat protein
LSESALLDVAGRLHAERSTAKPELARLREEISESWDAEIAPSWQTAGFVQELVIAASETLERDPEQSFELAQLSVVIAANLRREAYTDVLCAQLEATAWREVAMAHRFRSRYDAALRALDSADRAAGELAVLGHDRATIQLARAVVLRDEQRFDEALEILRDTADVFTEYGDGRRVLQCGMLAAVIRQGRGDLTGARDRYRSLLDEARAADDLHTLAGLYNNLGQVSAQLGDTGAAVEAFQCAGPIFEELRMPAETARVTWGLGRVLLASGQYDHAAAVITDARRTFGELGMKEEAGLAGLDLVEILLCKGAAEDAQALAASILADFESLQLGDRVVRALFYLRDAMKTPETASVKRVREYLERAFKEPDLVFARV